MVILTIQTVQKSKSPYLSNRLTGFDEIWHGDADWLTVECCSMQLMQPLWPPQNHDQNGWHRCCGVGCLGCPESAAR